MPEQLRHDDAPGSAAEFELTRRLASPPGGPTSILVKASFKLRTSSAGVRGLVLKKFMRGRRFQ